jgi:hypothetical protein
VVALSFASVALGCDQRPETKVVLENRYPASAATPLVVYGAFWQAVPFPQPLPPGSTSDPQDTGALAASANTAYVILSPGWDPTSADLPTSFVVMQSRTGFDVHLNDTLQIAVDDTTFAGNCAAGSFLSQDQADFITQRVFTQTLFPDAFPPFGYDAATCTTTPIGDAGGS